MLTTGRVLYHWHAGEMTRRSAGLMEVYGKSLVEVNADDASVIGVQDNKKILVTSRRGKMVANVHISDRVPPGLIYANFHFPESPVNELTIAALDPIAKIPEFKVCAVRLEKIEA